MTKTTNYDDFAQDYSKENESSLLNAYYERPAMLELAGEVTGHRILDIGCGSGPLAAALIERGALVEGFDASAAMINLARRRLGDAVPLSVARLGEPLNYADDSFDDAVASLVFHYLQNWQGALEDVRRVLKPDGRLMLSVNHPLLYPWTHPGEDYFKPTLYTDVLNFNGRPAELTYWHRPLHQTTDAFLQAGFNIERIWEPPYAKDAPGEYISDRLRERGSFLSFLFFSLRA